MYQKIVAPLDGSELAECSLAHFRAVAKGCAVADVVLLHVEEPFIYTSYPVIEEKTREEMRRKSKAYFKGYMTKAANRLKKDGINAETVILEGTPAEEILNYAKKNRADLIVISTHGSSGITRWAFGSVADRVMRHSPVPVLVIAPPGCRK